MDLISVLVLLYTVSGVTYESEVHMPHHACMAAAPAITLAAGIDAGPKIEMLDGTRVPVKSATCIPACFADAMSDMWDLKTLAEDEG